LEWFSWELTNQILCTSNSKGNSVTVAITSTLYLLRAGHNVRSITYKTALLDLEQQQNEQTENHKHSNRKKTEVCLQLFTSFTTSYLQSPSHHMLLNTIMTNRIKTPVHTKPHSYHHDNRFKTSKQKKNTALKEKTQVWLVCVVTAWRSHSSQFSLIRYKKQGGRQRGCSQPLPAHYGTSSWGVGYFVKGVQPTLTPPPGKYSPAYHAYAIIIIRPWRRVTLIFYLLISKVDCFIVLSCRPLVSICIKFNTFVFTMSCSQFWWREEEWTNREADSHSTLAEEKNSAQWLRCLKGEHHHRENN